jgi:aminoglycoside phosphotransferase family enzyme/predicted kinase
MNKPSRGSPGPDGTLPQALLRPQAWPGGEAPVELVETHISWVFLVGDLAYKVKKPVRLDFLDFSTPELRRHFCEEELRLNRRFAPQLYLGLSTVVSTGQGLAVDVPGQVVDHAVRMRRFDREEELDALLRRDAAAGELLEEFGQRLAGQHETAPRAGQDQSWAHPGRTLEACRENFSELRRLGDEPTRDRVEALAAWTERRFGELSPRFERRLRAGRFRECHGDLHCANVVRHEGRLWGFDALEFDPGLNWIDVASDLAFLSMDLRARGHPGLAAALLDGWLAASGDFDALGVLRFYEAYRAGVRAKVSAIRRSQHPTPGEADRGETEHYLSCATDAARDRQPRLVVMTGVSGSGKSWLARRLLEPLEAIRLRSDVERKRLAGLAAGEASDGTIYSPAMTRQTYSRLERLARGALQDGFSTVVDAACLRAGERRRFAQLARGLDVPFRLVSLESRRETLLGRIRDRAARGGDPSEATFGVLDRQLEFAEPLQPDEAADALVVQAGDDIDVGHVVRRLLAGTVADAASG